MVVNLEGSNYDHEQKLMRSGVYVFIARKDIERREAQAMGFQEVI